MQADINPKPTTPLAVQADINPKPTTPLAVLNPTDGRHRARGHALGPEPPPNLMLWQGG